MTSSVPARSGAATLLAAGVLFVVYPALRPWSDVSPSGALAAFTSPWWQVAHLAAVVGFLLAGLGIAALARRERTRTAGAAAALWWVGAGLTISYFGAEMFALHAIAGRVGDPVRVAELADAVRFGAVGATVFGVGLVALAVSAVLVAVILRRKAFVAALPFAVAMVLFLPQFFAAPPLRIAHGVLLGVGCLLLARTLWRTPAGAERLGPERQDGHGAEMDLSAAGTPARQL